MKSHCERCAAPLTPTDAAMICSLETTYCPSCAQALDGWCPSCGGQLAPRPTRTSEVPTEEHWTQKLAAQMRDFVEPRAEPYVTVERFIPLPAAQIFEVLASPDRHADFDGSGTVHGLPLGPARLEPDSTFSMAMKVQGLQYRSVNHVVEFEEGRRIAWQTFAEFGGRRVAGGQQWRFELEERPGGTLVRHTYDWSRAIGAKFTIEMPGFPERFERSGPVTLERLEDVAGRTATP